MTHVGHAISHNKNLLKVLLINLCKNVLEKGLRLNLIWESSLFQITFWKLQNICNEAYFIILKEFRIVFHLTNTYIESKLTAWFDFKYTFLFIFNMLQKKMYNTQIPVYNTSKHVHIYILCIVWVLFILFCLLLLSYFFLYI